ncbi:MAG: VOC family protein [Emcibacteraceae bacterium]|nr:VOC family protein [Emcibacteraceae bacterium]
MNIISYAMVGSKDLKRSGDFFDKVFSTIGARRAMEGDTMIMWAVSEDQPFFAVCLPNDGNEATSGNGTMISFGADSSEQVDAMYNAALANGATCEGPSGPRGEGKYYIGYFRDPDGNKFAAFHMVG